jgi:hypothetical protein
MLRIFLHYLDTKGTKPLRFFLITEITAFFSQRKQRCYTPINSKSQKTSYGEIATKDCKS